ncbi:HEAT repeat domain-containing protein [Methanolacinia petrolearia]|uniref:HEAT repeat domain-containing protein n=1 Tax=Methanolacinia petrolearia TaxID=54120 RepID=UPI003BA9FC49
MRIAGHLETVNRNNGDFVRLFVLVVYFLVVGILAVYAFSPIGGEMGYILARLIPHLFYIPLVLTALWYPKKRLAHFIIFSLIFFCLISGFLMNGWSLDALFMVFTSFIYLWVFIAILAIPQVQLGKTGEKTASGESIAPPALQAPLSAKSSLAPAASGGNAGLIKRTPSIGPSQINPLIESFRHGEELVTKNTSVALKAIGAPAIPFIVGGLKSDSIPVRENCARLLGEMDDTDSIDLLVAAMADPSRRVHNAATQALARICEPSVPALKRGLTSEKWKIRAGSVVALRIIGSHDSVPLLTGMLGDKSHYVRKKVVKSLARAGREEILDYLVGMLDDESRGVRLAAVGGLGRSGKDEAVESLVRVLEEEEDAEVRIRAVHSLELIGTSVAYEAMKVALDDNDPEVSSEAEDILRQNYKI